MAEGLLTKGSAPGIGAWQMSQLWSLPGLHGLHGTLWSGAVLLLPHCNPLLSNTVKQLRLPSESSEAKTVADWLYEGKRPKQLFPERAKLQHLPKYTRTQTALWLSLQNRGRGRWGYPFYSDVSRHGGGLWDVSQEWKPRRSPSLVTGTWPIPRDAGSHAGEWGLAPFLLPAPTWLNFSKRLRTVVPSQDSIDDLQVLSWDLQRALLAPCLPDGPWPKWLWQSEQAGQYHSLSSGFFQKRCSDWGSCFVFSVLGTVVTGQSTDNIQPEIQAQITTSCPGRDPLYIFSF